MVYLGPRSLDDMMTLDDYMNYMKIKWGERCIAEVTHHYQQICVGGNVGISTCACVFGTRACMGVCVCVRSYSGYGILYYAHIICRPHSRKKMSSLA